GVRSLRGEIVRHGICAFVWEFGVQCHRACLSTCAFLRYDLFASPRALAESRGGHTEPKAAAAAPSLRKRRPYHRPNGICRGPLRCRRRRLPLALLLKIRDHTVHNFRKLRPRAVPREPLELLK